MVEGDDVGKWVGVIVGEMDGADVDGADVDGEDGAKCWTSGGNTLGGGCGK